jgi:abortive infection bacteriophage resistance protein
MLKRFSKSSLTLDQQIEHLSSHGLEIADEAAAKYWLAHISYYRLSAYWLYFEAPKGTVPRFPETAPVVARVTSFCALATGTR